MIKVRALSQPRQLVIASWRPGFDPTSLHVGFMVARLSLGMFILFFSFHLSVASAYALYINLSITSSI